MARTRLLSRSLSGYLCGTHSGWLARRQGDLLSVDALSATRRAWEPPPAAEMLTLERRWEPEGPVASLAARFGVLLEHPAIVDLLVYGSQAGGTPTGFSDLDAVLVIEDRAAEDGTTLRALRTRVLAAQRALLAYQPMQHHGFEVATPKLLISADAALDLPREALQDSRSLFGRRIDAGFSGAGVDPARRLRSLVTRLSALSAWPRHVWRLHGTVSMFELLPALYLQATGVAVSKASSFALARQRFQGAWWPYDVLEQTREVWPRRRNRRLEAGASAARNPWVAVAVWTRLPSPWPAAARPLLSDRCLNGLQELARLMAADTG
jgi:hypothetical protein